MGIFFNVDRFSIGQVRQIQPNRTSNVYFGNDSKTDSFQNNSVLKYFDKSQIEALIKNNPEINKILSEHNISKNLNIEELNDLKNNHCKDTRQICLNITKNLPYSLKNKVDINVLCDGALLHDIGKVLIPTKILNKNSSLSSDEFAIMHMHSELGYQLLKSTPIDKRVLNLVRYHHNNLSDNKYIPDINLQILNLADKYSALTEKRVYKEAYTPQQALTILYQEVKKGLIHPFLFNALVKSVQNNGVGENVKIS